MILAMLLPNPPPITESSTRECGDNNGGCEQICERSDDGEYQCRCYKGFLLRGDRFSCEGELYFYYGYRRKIVDDYFWAMIVGHTA